MGNCIGFNSQTAIDECLYMSNGMTNVFINTLLLSGSMLARTEGEKRLIIWLAEKDQSQLGSGNVGFDICEMPWNIQTFEKDKQFLLKVIAEVKKKAGWEMLNYSPNEEMLSTCLKQFANLVSQMGKDDIQPELLEEWIVGAHANDPVVCGFPVCNKHGTFLTCYGCQICNN